MPHEAHDPAYLWDMLEAARTIKQITAGVSLGKYKKDRVLQLAIERLFEIIGIAARRVSDALKQSHPEIPWQRIVGQRNVLAHEYGDIQHVLIWKVVVTDIPTLIEALEPLIPPLPPEIP